MFPVKMFRLWHEVRVLGTDWFPALIVSFAGFSAMDFVFSDMCFEMKKDMEGQGYFF